MEKNIETINGKRCKLHSTKCGNKNIGFVPVLLSKNISDYVDTYGADVCVSAIRSALAIKYQAQARKAVSGGKMTDADFDRIASKLLAENADKYIGNFALLRTDAERIFESESGSVDEKKVWYEFVPHSADDTDVDDDDIYNGDIDDNDIAGNDDE